MDERRPDTERQRALPQRLNRRARVQVLAALVAVGGVWAGPAGAASSRQSVCTRFDDFYLCDAAQTGPAKGQGDPATGRFAQPSQDRATIREARRDARSACSPIPRESNQTKETPLCS